MNQKEIYDMIYARNPGYNEPREADIELAMRFAERFKGQSILDVGCGAGHLLERMLDWGHQAYGLEISEECYRKHLRSLPVFPGSILLMRLVLKVDVIICMDVLEHIQLDEIDANVRALASMAPVALIAVANHSDVQEGIELHQIQKGWKWWKDKLEISGAYSVAGFGGFLGEKKNSFYFVCA